MPDAHRRGTGARGPGGIRGPPAGSALGRPAAAGRVARALVNRPAVLLLDEPLGALDLKLRKRLQIELAQIHRDVGTTFVYVTHDQEEAMSMATRIAVMNDGRIEQVGTPHEIYHRRDRLRRRFHRRVELHRGRRRSRRPGFARQRCRGSRPRPRADRAGRRSWSGRSRSRFGDRRIRTGQAYEEGSPSPRSSAVTHAWR